MLDATRCLQSGEYHESMELGCAAVEGLLALRTETIVRVVRQRLPALDCGVRILSTEVGYRVELSRMEYAEDECVALLHYSILLHEALNAVVGNDGLPIHFSFTERVLLTLQKISRKCVASHHSFSTSRVLLRGLLSLRFTLMRFLPFENAAAIAQARDLSFLLHEPEPEAQALLRNFRFYSEYNFARRHLHLHRLPGSQQFIDSFIWPEKQAYIDYIAAQPGSRVLVTIHMGDFLGAFRCIAALANSRRAAISLRREQESDREKNYAFGNRLDHQVLRHGQYNPISIVSALRRGNHTLAVLFDLREEFGETIAATFFGHRARFVKGPAQLAIMGKAPILPFITFESNNKSYIEMESIIETHLLPTESLQCATSRITQQLVFMAEKWISRTPAQWKYLNSISAYFEAPTTPVGAIPAREDSSRLYSPQCRSTPRPGVPE